MPRILSGTRYLILIPVIGLAIAASVFFIFGGIGLIKLLVNIVIAMITNMPEETASTERGIVIFEIVEYVHLFLIGTVLYITAVGLYQLFIHEIKFPNWLKIDSTEELETNLIGVTVVVLAVNFMGAVFIGQRETLLEFGAGIALPIAALGVFLGLRAWSTKILKRSSTSETVNPDSIDPAPSQEDKSK
ncbi:MAG: YqhA family protein [Chloroflexota bacterium]|nr:MAG: YqhA family protein [Chloroflexota bacterium]